ncbi:MAG TPA: hypothetical protein VF399_07390 [bacterium]|jgi:hypothetical protein
MSVIMVGLLFLTGVNFPICTESTNSQYYPAILFANNQFYAFWADARYYNADYTYCLYGARVTNTGTVLDVDGKMLFRDSCISKPNVAHDGANCMAVFRNGC